MNREEKMNDALIGTAVGDAFGERFFVHPAVVDSLIAARALPEQSLWRFTDDTHMALSIRDVLLQFGTVDQEALATLFAYRYHLEPERGYGGGAHRLLQEIGQGVDWQSAAAALFDGSGSYGNGGAMRAAPLGAYFNDDLERCAEEARKSAQVTHANINGIEGAVAIAVATAHAIQSATPDLIATAMRFLRPCETRDNVDAASRIPLDANVDVAVKRLGSGVAVSAQDTVGFSLWCAQRHVDSFEEAMWTTVSGLGDRDTTCAIVGGILAARLGVDAIPSMWRERTEALPDSITVSE